MDVIQSVDEIRSVVRAAKARGCTVGYIITTGELHEGHLHLVDHLKVHADFIIVSNVSYSKQLNFTMEYYNNTNPSTEHDRSVLEGNGVDVLFAPPPREIYPHGYRNHTTVVVPGEISEDLCNVGREGIYLGVATFVLKHFNIIQPDVTMWGEKDYQQFAVCRKMVRDMMLPIQMLSAPVKRMDNGLAYASRNASLTEDELGRANMLYRAMSHVKTGIENGEEDFKKLASEARELLMDYGFLPDYIKVKVPDTLADAKPGDKEMIIFGSAYLGKDRLVDTLRFKLD